MTAPTYPRPVLSERQRDMLTSLGLTYETTELAILIYHGDMTFTRLDRETFDIWLRGYLDGRARR